MKISTENLVRAIETWITDDLISKGTTLQQAVITFVLLQGKQNILSNIKPYADMLTDTKGCFDFALLTDNLHKTMDKIGGSYTIPGINYRFDVADVDKILSYCKGYLTND